MDSFKNSSVKTTSKELVDGELGILSRFPSDQTREAIARLSHERGADALKTYQMADGSLEIPDSVVDAIRERIRRVIRQVVIELTSVYPPATE